MEQKYHSRLNGEELHRKLGEAFLKLDIEDRPKNSLLENLAKIREVDKPTEEHSIRVGLKGIEVAEYTHIVSPKSLFYPGILHDIGKTKIRKALLENRVGWTEMDSIEMEDHVMFGFNILKDIHKFSAYVLLFHHKFHKGYPRNLPEWPREFSESTRAIITYCGNLLAITDCWDAASTRKNDKFSPGIQRYSSREEVKSYLLKQNKGQEYLINNLYNEGIL